MKITNLVSQLFTLCLLFPTLSYGVPEDKCTATVSGSLEKCGTLRGSLKADTKGATSQKEAQNGQKGGSQNGKNGGFQNGKNRGPQNGKNGGSQNGQKEGSQNDPKGGAKNRHKRELENSPKGPKNEMLGVDDFVSRSLLYKGSCDLTEAEKNAKPTKVYEFLQKKRSVCENNRKVKVGTGCKHSYMGVIVDLLPFATSMKNTVNMMFQRCCGQCVKLCTLEIIEEMANMSNALIGNYDLVFPVLAKSSLPKVDGFYFQPIYDAPGIYYFTEGISSVKMSQKLLLACQNLWPLLTICLLLAVISGGIAWSIETWANEGEFPRPFHVGLFEGFWWSFVSMTTVGYGDKAPKSRLGRIFSIIWILVGITICSMFTASLTTEITKWSSTPIPTIDGNSVAALKYRLLDAVVVAKEGGVMKEVTSDNITHGVKKMVELLQSGEVNGFVLDTWTHHYFISQTRRTQPDLVNAVEDLSRTEVFYDGDQLSFGMLFKQEEDRSYFESYFLNNQLHLEACHHFQMNVKMKYSKDKQAFIFDPNGGLYFTALYWIIGVIAVISALGFLYEFHRHFLRKNRIRKIGQPDGTELK